MKILLIIHINYLKLKINLINRYIDYLYKDIPFFYIKRTTVFKHLEFLTKRLSGLEFINKVNHG